jgi:hypothetical protein
VKLNYPSGHLSQLSKISNNMNLLWQLMCRQIYNSKDETNDDEKSQRDETRYVNCGVGILCHDCGQYNEILARGDQPFQNVGDIDICWEKFGKQKRRGAFESREALLLEYQAIAFTRLLYPSTTLIVWCDMYICVGHLRS